MAELWTYEEHRDCDIARAQFGEFDVKVVDLDGDLSEWTVSVGGNVVANGGVAVGDHFEAAKAAAWAVLPSL